MSKNNKNDIQIIFRNIRRINLNKMVDLTKCCIASLSNHENYKVTPKVKNVLIVAKALNVKPDILLYSYGILPEDEQKIIKSDPFYYMEKIKKLCNNHSKRYGDEEVDLSTLNNLRAFEYALKGDNDDKNK